MSNFRGYSETERLEKRTWQLLVLLLLTQVGMCAINYKLLDVRARVTVLEGK